jgi:hypothetical protein
MFVKLSAEAGHTRIQYEVGGKNTSQDIEEEAA